MLTVVTIVGSGLLFLYSLQLSSKAPFFPRVQDQNPADLTPDRLRRLLPFPGFTFQVGGFPLKFGFPEVFALEVAVVLAHRRGPVRPLHPHRRRRARLGGEQRAGVAARHQHGPDRPDRVGHRRHAVGGHRGAHDLRIATPGGSTRGWPEFLFPPLAAAVLAKFRNLAVAIYASVLIGLFTAATAFTFRGAPLRS